VALETSPYADRPPYGCTCHACTCPGCRDCEPPEIDAETRAWLDWLEATEDPVEPPTDDPWSEK